MDAAVSPFTRGLAKTTANYAALSPLSFLARAADVFPETTAIVHGTQRTDYGTFYRRARRLASALAGLGIARNDTVSVMLSNVPPMLEAHYGVPMAGAVLHSMNTRLDAAVIAFQLDHADCKVLITDREYAKVVKEALALATAQANVITAAMPKHPVYLWTLPMFHCNGWCFPWSLSLVAGTHVCLRWVRPQTMWDLIADETVTHLCGAPIIMSTLLNAPADQKRTLDHVVEFYTAAAPPPESVLAAMKTAGFNVTHLYGLTEVYGPAVVNDWKREWNDLPPDRQAQKKARQGVRYVALEDLAVLDPETLEPVPADGETLGEVMFRGNVVMKGYLNNPEATEKAFRGGWFHSGDLGVMYPDGYIQLKDRSKDIIISGGENISSIEIEEVLYKHPDVQAVAVVARPDEKWGETPCAFVELRQDAKTGENDLIAFCREHLAGFKTPRKIVFCDLPKTSTGKIQKF
ncbi:UNVERIFIED_CONTAM: hypothetical protein GTU68_048408, partial [Idotea baltica]|nr:hypothetical protein [Idotea baltica]